MGVSPEVLDLFLANTVYTPVQQTKLVNALAEMQGVDDRGQFVKFAVLTRDPEVAFFRARQAEMYARFHKRVSKVKQFVPLGELAAARLADGTLVFCAPLDHLAWTQTMANYVLAANQNVTAAPGIKAKHCRSRVRSVPWRKRPSNSTVGKSRTARRGGSSTDGRKTLRVSFPR